LAWEACIQKKNEIDLSVFLSKNTILVAKFMAQAKMPLTDAALENRPPWSSGNRLKEFGFTVFTMSGELTKYNRVCLGRPKDQSLDAIFVRQVAAVERLLL
jgi:hypothetical protein